MCIVGIRIRAIMHTRINVSPTHMSINDIPDHDGNVHLVSVRIESKKGRRQVNEKLQSGHIGMV